MFTLAPTPPRRRRSLRRKGRENIERASGDEQDPKLPDIGNGKKSKANAAEEID
jgi:hypothetical protein